jgi:hypothetical protein
MYSADVALQQGFDSSISDYGILDDLSAFNCAADKSLSSVDPSSDFCDKQFSDSFLFNDEKNLSSFGEQASIIVFLFEVSIHMVDKQCELKVAAHTP